MCLEEVEVAGLHFAKLGEGSSESCGPLQRVSKQLGDPLGVSLSFADTLYVLKNALVRYEHLQVGLPYEGNYGVLDRGGEAVEFLIFDHNTNSTFVPDHGGVRSHFRWRVLGARWRRIRVVRRGVDVAWVIRRASMVGLAGRRFVGLHF